MNRFVAWLRKQWSVQILCRCPRCDSKMLFADKYTVCSPNECDLRSVR